jgi:uncharacterized membrane protein
VRSLLVQFRKSFIAGLLLVLPLMVTLWILYTGFRLLVGFTSPLVKLAFERLGEKPPAGFTEVLSLLLTVLLLTLLGLAGRSYVGRKAWQGFELLLLRIPLAKAIYSATKQLLESLQRQKGFQRVVLVEFPRAGCWVMGFMTSPSEGVLNTRAGELHYNIFVPTTPNPTSGYLVVVPGSEVLQLDMSVEDGITFIMSGGMVSPELRQRVVPVPPSAGPEGDSGGAHGADR